MDPSMAEPFPPLEELLPHAGPMRLLRRVLCHSPEQTRCELYTGDAAQFATPAGRVPNWVALEWMAQCMAVHGRLAGRREGSGAPGLPAEAVTPTAALLSRIRRVELHVESFAADERLEVEANFERGDGRLAALRCVVRAGPEAPVLAEGRLTASLVAAGSDALGAAPPLL
jgi:predicted hotdog family 3-hydroxylacyl-ACP dehydratase